MGTFTGWDSAPFDWQNDPEYADPVPDVLGAADDANEAAKENGSCPTCNGRGYISAIRDCANPFSGMLSTDPRCPACESASPPSLEWAANLTRLTYGPKVAE